MIEFYDLGNGERATKFKEDYDIRCYEPPAGYVTVADLVDIHPVTGEQMEQAEWWVFIKLDEGYK